MISSQKIKDLRLKTGAGMMDCKKALLEVDGDLEGAIDWLRKKGINTAQKKSDRSASEGLITVIKKEDAACIIEINSETDFVARNKEFQDFCVLISQTILNYKIKDINNLIKSKVFNSNQTVENSLTEIIAKIGENILIKRFDYIHHNENHIIQKYVHNSVNDNSGKIGVLLTLKCDNKTENIHEFSKNLAMHIAAMTPKSIDISDLDASLVDREKKIYEEQEEKSNKPENIKEKIVSGKLNKFYSEVCLLKQNFVMENKKSIKEYITDFEKSDSNKVEIVGYIIYKVGENL